MISPLYMKPLLDGTPLSMERIKLAWPDLSVSDRALLLTTLLVRKYEKPNRLHCHHQRQLVDLALADNNAYIRYLGAKWVDKPYYRDPEHPSSDEKLEKAQFQKISSDPEALVRAAPEEERSTGRDLYDPPAFWQRPRALRLAQTNRTVVFGEPIAALLRYAAKELLPTGGITGEDMLDVLLQHLSGRNLSERLSSDFEMRLNITQLWELIPDVPPLITVALLKYLPTQVDSEQLIPSAIIDALDRGDLIELLSREDVLLQEVRYKIFQESSDDELLTSIAVGTPWFTLRDSDIADLIVTPSDSSELVKKKIKTLSTLATAWQGATLVQTEAICDLIEQASRELQEEADSSSILTIARTHQANRAKHIGSSWVFIAEIFAWRLYELCRYHLSSGKDEARQFFSKSKDYEDQVVPGAPWRTYMNLSTIVDQYNWEKVVDYLPRVHGEFFEIPQKIDDEIEHKKTIDHEDLLRILKDLQVKFEANTSQGDVDAGKSL